MNFYWTNLAQDIALWTWHLLLFSSLSDDRAKASSKTIPPHSAIQSLLFQMRVSSPVLKVMNLVHAFRNSSKSWKFLTCKATAVLQLAQTLTWQFSICGWHSFTCSALYHFILLSDRKRVTSRRTASFPSSCKVWITVVGHVTEGTSTTLNQLVAVHQCTNHKEGLKQTVRVCIQCDISTSGQCCCVNSSGRNKHTALQRETKRLKIKI